MNFQKSHSNAPQLDGVLLVDKPRGCTSHDIVDFVRRRYKFAKVGHCGTLDPLATGLLMLGIGKATKVQDLLMSEDKIYAGTMKLGQTTVSQDADGQVEEEKPVPNFTTEQIQAAFDKYIGDFYQTPPMVSALKQGGVPLYKLAREGKTVHREPRLITVYWNKILSINLPFVRFEIRCTKGFYVRTYCHDIGQDLGTGAHLTELSRLQSGNFTLDRAVGWEQLQQINEVGELVPHILSLAEVSKLRRQ